MVGSILKLNGRHEETRRQVHLLVLPYPCSSLVHREFFLPTDGRDSSVVLKAGGILALMQAIAIVGQNLANGKDVTFKKDDIEIKVGDEEDDKG